MAVRGETIGVAYVKIHADGHDLGPEVRKELQGLDDDVSAAGGRHSEAYIKEWNKRMSQKDIGKSLRDSLEKGIAKSDVATAYFKSRDWERFRGLLRKRFGEEGEAAADSLVTEFRHNLSGIDDAVEGIMPRIEQMRRDIEASARDMDLGHYVVTIDVDQDEKEIDRVVRNIDKVGESAQKLERSKTGGFWRELRTGAQLSGRDINLFSGHIDRFSEKFARAFGRGSRNDFINFFGSFMALPLRAIGGIVKLGESFGGFIDKFRQAEGVAQKIGTIIPTLGRLGIAAAGAVAVISFVIGPVISFVASLAGAVIALAGSISFALVGALGALAGALLPVVFGLGVATLGITKMDNATKKLVTDSLRPLGAELDRLGQKAARGMFSNIEEQARKFGSAMRIAEPLVEKVGVALSHVRDSCARAFSGPEYRAFINSMTSFLPHAVESLGDSFANLSTGLMGMFRSLTPLTDRFLNWLNNTTKSFSDWANSARGQRSLTDFFDRAGDAAATLWDLIKNVGRDIGLLFNFGEPEGTKMIQDLADKFREWGDWMAAHPDQVKKWFGDAADTARRVGEVVDGLLKLFDELDNPKNRKIVEDTLGAIAVSLRIIRFLLETTNPEKWAEAISGAFESVKKAAGNVRDRVVGVFSGIGSKIGAAFGGIRERASRAFNALRDKARDIVDRIVNFFQRLPGRIVAFIQRLPGMVDRIMNRLAFIAGFVVGRIVKFFRDLPGKIGNALSRLAGIVRGKFNDAVNRVPPLVERIRSFFQQLPGKIGRALASLPGIIRSKFQEAASRIPGIVSNIVGAFRGLAGRIAGAIGSVWGAISSRFQAIPANARAVAGGIVSAFAGLGSRIMSAIGSINIGSLISWPAGKLGQLARGFVAGSSAAGGIYVGPQVRLIGEAGPEAVVPLNRPLGMVDPAVRALSALAQGMTPPAMASGGVAGAQRIVEVGGIHIVTPTTDPAAVAQETVNRLVAVGY